MDLSFVYILFFFLSIHNLVLSVRRLRLVQLSMEDEAVSSGLLEFPSASALASRNWGSARPSWSQSTSSSSSSSSSASLEPGQLILTQIPTDFFEDLENQEFDLVFVAFRNVGPIFSQDFRREQNARNFNESDFPENFR